MINFLIKSMYRIRIEQFVLRVWIRITMLLSRRKNRSCAKRKSYLIYIISPFQIALGHHAKGIFVRNQYPMSCKLEVIHSSTRGSSDFFTPFPGKFEDPGFALHSRCGCFIMYQCGWWACLLHPCFSFISATTHRIYVFSLFVSRLF